MRKVVKIAGYLTLLCSVYLFYVFFSSLIERNDIISKGNKTIGKVLGYEYIKNDGGGLYVFTFEYFVEGKRYLKTSDFNTSSIDYNNGDEFTIYYDKLNPNKAVIKSWNETVGINYAGGILASTFLVFGLLMTFVKYKYIEPLLENARKGYLF
ncbi:MAG: DUF3592 domain-containing protein [Flavobacteriales bacterium]|nr:DUF3592 domain-containing protein [Flavobacteriales bacterium]